MYANLVVIPDEKALSRADEIGEPAQGVCEALDMLLAKEGKLLGVLRTHFVLDPA